MKASSKRLAYLFGGALIACSMAIPVAHGQASGSKPNTQEKPLMAEDVFKNVQLLRGIPVKEFMDTMGFFSASTSLNCIDCHEPQESDTSLEGYAKDTPMKQTARKMILLVQTINKGTFGGQRKVTCFTCHRASDRPKTIPSLLEQYAAPEDDPDEVEAVSNPATAKPVNQVNPDQILDKYLQAIGGAQQAAKLTSFTAKGTYEGFETYSEKVPVEIFANAPDQLTTVVHTQHGDTVSTYDGTHGWIAAADKLMRVLPLFGGDLEGAKIDASLSFPAGIEKEFKWRAGFPAVTIDDRPVDVVQVAGGDLGAKLYFDKESGLLVRQVRYSDTAVGIIPAQVDYSDYRDVAGVKMPFHWVVTWTDGQSTIELSEVQPNNRIDRARFAQPAPPKAQP